MEESLLASTYIRAVEKFWNAGHGDSEGPKVSLAIGMCEEPRVNGLTPACWYVCLLGND